MIARKLAGAEQGLLSEADLSFYQREYERLHGELEGAYRASALPEAPAGKAALNDLLVQLRLSVV